jgi:hypothetical protein
MVVGLAPRLAARKSALAENPPTRRLSAKELAEAEALAASLVAADQQVDIVPFP